MSADIIHPGHLNIIREASKLGEVMVGVSQTDQAQRMKVSRPYITKVLHQDVNFSFRTAAKLANALKMDFFPELRPQEEQTEFSA